MDFGELRSAKTFFFPPQNFVWEQALGNTWYFRSLVLTKSSHLKTLTTLKVTAEVMYSEAGTQFYIMPKSLLLTGMQKLILLPGVRVKDIQRRCCIW